VSEELRLPVAGGVAGRFAALLPQLEALLAGETDQTASLANAVAALATAFDYLWVGVYRLVGDELVLGPFQGPPACTRIPLGKGVCGTAAARGETLVVPDVDAFPGHIACSSASRSEIVVPLLARGKLFGVLDVDSAEIDAFGGDQQAGLEATARILGEHLSNC
jgi:GAF domain-containing protein